MPKSRSGIVREKYCIIKGTGRKLSPICSQHEVRETQTGDIWLARIYNKHLLREKGLEDAAEFCYAVLKDCQEKENVIYIQQVLETEDSNLIIQEKYDRTLPELVREECPVRWTTAEDIIRDVFTAVVEIYSDKFYTRSIRPEHIVCVDEVWKIQTLVFDTEDYYLRDDIVWVPDFASPEQRLAEGKLPASQRDEQLVWGLGILALYMFLGPSFDYQSITQDSHVPWAKIEKLCSEVMFKFMRKVLRVNFEERMRLNELVRHQIFTGLLDSQGHPFMSQSKYLGKKKSARNEEKIVSILAEDKYKLQLLQNEVERFKYFMQVERFVQELPFKNSSDINLIRYLSAKVAYQNLVKIKVELLNWKKQNTKFEKYALVPGIEAGLKNAIEAALKLKQTYAKTLESLDLRKSEVPELRKQLSNQVSDQSVPYYQVVNLYMKVAGFIYTALSKQCLKAQNQDKQRTIVYYSIGAYLAYFYEYQLIGSKKLPQAYIREDVIMLDRLVREAPLDLLVPLSQELLREKFATLDDK